MKIYPVEVCIVDENIIDYDTNNINNDIPIAIEIPYSVAQLTSNQNVCVVINNARNTTTRNIRDPVFLQRLCLIYMIILFFSIILFVIKM